MNISQHIGRWFYWTTATWITLFGGLLALIGILLFLLDHDWAAIAVLTISFLTDWWDGCVARHQQGERPEMTREEEADLTVWQRINYRGVTHLGRAVDPLVDKIRFLGLMWAVGLGVLDVGVMALLTFLAVLLTLARPIKTYFRLEHGGANRWGKYKVYAEVILMVVLVFGTRPLWGGANPLAKREVTGELLNALSSLTAILALASTFKHYESTLTHFLFVRRTD